MSTERLMADQLRTIADDVQELVRTASHLKIDLLIYNLFEVQRQLADYKEGKNWRP